VSSTQFFPLTASAFLTIASAKFGAVAVPDELDAMAILAASVGELELVLRKMQPYFCATWEIALATPE
jgi:hypothetical protein